MVTFGVAALRIFGPTGINVGLAEFPEIRALQSTVSNSLTKRLVGRPLVRLKVLIVSRLKPSSQFNTLQLFGHANPGVFGLPRGVGGGVEQGVGVVEVNQADFGSSSFV
jgi:hypothetical protein